MSELVIGQLIAHEEIRAGDVVDIVLDRDTGATYARRHQPAPVGERTRIFDLDSLTWDCMVCGGNRPDARISVAHRPVAGFEAQFPDTIRMNVRYCNDRAGCVTIATAPGPWPPGTTAAESA